MKKLVFFSLLGLAALVSLAPAQAQIMGQYGGFATPLGAVSSAPVATTPEQVALLFYMLANRRPDFKALAAMSDEYKNANDFDKQKMMDSKVNSLKNNFEMTSPTDKLVVKIPVTVSAFSVRNKGFIINELNDNMIFKYTYCDHNYAFISQGLGQHQWLDASDDATAAAVDKARGKDSVYTLFITLAPTYADKPERLTELDDGKEYSIMTGATDDIALYDAEGKTFLWTNKRKAEVETDPLSADILKLKQ